MKIDVRRLFATPMASFLVPGADGLCSDLKARILARTKTEAGRQHSNLGGWQSGFDLADWGGPGIRQLLEILIGTANQLTIGRDGQPISPAWKAVCWANVNQEGHGNEFHTHPGCFWSAVFYVDDGGIGGTASLGGEFEVQDPRGVAPAMYAPHLTIKGPDGPSLGASELLRPRSGLMVIFPSWLSHGVRPYNGHQTRISIAFNLSL
ncbi:MAG: TIGR02466 family protein [Pseudomonadota bacterium]